MKEADAEKLSWKIVFIQRRHSGMVVSLQKFTAERKLHLFICNFKMVPTMHIRVNLHMWAWIFFHAQKRGKISTVEGSRRHELLMLLGKVFMLLSEIISWLTRVSYHCATFAWKKTCWSHFCHFFQVPPMLIPILVTSHLFCSTRSELPALLALSASKKGPSPDLPKRIWSWTGCSSRTKVRLVVKMPRLHSWNARKRVKLQWLSYDSKSTFPSEVNIQSVLANLMGHFVR